MMIGIGILEMIWHDIIVIIVHIKDIEIIGLVIGMDLLSVIEVISPNVISGDEGLIFSEGNYI
jgi:hypothetical protein